MKQFLLAMSGVWLLGLGYGWGLEAPRGCFRSVAEAAAVTHTLEPESVGPENTGFRLEDLRRDRMLNKRWAMVRSCDHPERPLIAVELGEAGESVGTTRQTAAVAYAAQVVQAGARVRVRGSDAGLRFETTGVAESNGTVGQAIGVRLDNAVGGDGSAVRVLKATVRSADLLEWEP